MKFYLWLITAYRSVLRKYVKIRKWTNFRTIHTYAILSHNQNFTQTFTLLICSLKTWTSKLNSETVPDLPSLNPSLIFPFHQLPSLVHPNGFSFYIFPGSLPFFHHGVIEQHMLSIFNKKTTINIAMIPIISGHYQLDWLKHIITIICFKYKPYNGPYRNKYFDNYDSYYISGHYHAAGLTKVYNHINIKIWTTNHLIYIMYRSLL